MPGSRARMSCSVWLGERSISTELMMLVDAPVRTVPETTPEPEAPDGSVVVVEVPSPSSASLAGPCAGAPLRERTRLGPGTSRVLVTLMPGNATVSRPRRSSCAPAGVQLKIAAHPSNMDAYALCLRRMIFMTRVLHLQRSPSWGRVPVNRTAVKTNERTTATAAISLMLWIVGEHLSRPSQRLHVSPLREAAPCGTPRPPVG